MITVLAEIIATEHRGDLRRAADRSRLAATPQAPDTTRVELRHTRREDADIVQRLAVLDESPSARRSRTAGDGQRPRRCCALA